MSMNALFASACLSASVADTPAMLPRNTGAAKSHGCCAGSSRGATAAGRESANVAFLFRRWRAWATVTANNWPLYLMRMAVDASCRDGFSKVASS